VFLLKSVLT